MSNTLNMYTTPSCCVTLQQPLSKELFYIPPPPPATFIIPIFHAPTTTSTLKTTIKTTSSKILTALFKQEQKFDENTSTSPSNMISQRIFENLVLTNTIVAAFCIILMITLTAFLIFLLIPSIRRRWINDKQNNQKRFDDSTTLARQQSLQQFTLGPSRINPLFESSTTTAAASPLPSTATQFTPFFQPHTTATVLHPTIWTPVTLQQTQVASPTPSSTTATTTIPNNTNKTMTAAATTNNASTTTAAAATGRPPLPSHPPTTVQRSPKRR